MPLDLRPYFNAELGRLAPLFKTLAERLVEHTRHVRTDEQMLVMVPLLRYYGGALAVEIAAGQHGLLLLPRDRLGHPGERLAAGLATLPEPVKAELLVRSTLARIADVLAGVRASLERFRTPTPEMFDDRRARASDVVGLTALTLRASAASPVALGIARLAVPAGEEKPAQPSRPLGAVLEQAGRPLLALATGLPVLVDSLLQLAPALGRTAKASVLTALAGVEGRLDEVARAVRDAIPRALTGIDGAARWLDAFALLFGLAWPALTAFVERWAEHIALYLRGLATTLTSWGIYLKRLLENVVKTVNRLGDMDLLGPLHSAAAPRLTLNMLSDDQPGARAAARTALIAIAGGLQAIQLFGYAQRVQAADDLAAIVLAGAGEPPPEVVFRTPPGFQDAVAQVFADGRDERFKRMVADTMKGLGGLLGRQLGTAATLADRVGTVFAGERRAVTLGNRAEYEALARRAHEQAQGLQVKPAAGREDPLARAFERALADGGVALAGDAVGIYVKQLRRYWDKRVVRLTSPHILAARGRLGAVRTPRLIVRVAGRPADGDLLREVTARVKTAVGEAYVTALGAPAGAVK